MAGYYWVDLHVHTTLSPCGELEMGAPEIVARAREAGLDIIAVSDHNSCDNYPAVAECAAGNPVVLPAIEVQTSEDVHMLTLFRDYDTAVCFQKWLWERMPPIANDPDIFGYQVVIDASNEIIRMEDTLLVQGVGYDIDTIIEKAHSKNALVILAHIDRPSFAYPAVLGPIPPNYPVDALELSRRLNSDQAAEWREQYPSFTFIRSSDSHSLDTLSRSNCSRFYMEDPTFDEIHMALTGSNGRRVSWPWG